MKSLSVCEYPIPSHSLNGFSINRWFVSISFIILVVSKGNFQSVFPSTIMIFHSSVKKNRTKQNKKQLPLLSPLYFWVPLMTQLTYTHIQCVILRYHHYTLWCSRVFPIETLSSWLLSYDISSYSQYSNKIFWDYFTLHCLHFSPGICHFSSNPSPLPFLLKGI